MKVPKVTLALAAITVLAYIVFSQSLLYIPSSILLQYGFSFDNWIGLIFYSFLHVSPNHLIGNLLLLLFVGTIAEQKLNKKDMTIIYFLSGAAAAITFSLLQQNTVLVGASAAISGLIAAAAVVDIKKFVVSIVAFSLLIFLIGPPLYQYSADQIELLRTQTNTLQQHLENTSQQLEIAKAQNDTALIQNLSQEFDTTYYELNTTTRAQTNLEEGVDREKRSSTSSLAHVIGAAVGFLYMWRRRPDLLWALPYQILPRRYLKLKRVRKR